MVDESGDHRKDVEQSTNANISPLTSEDESTLMSLCGGSEVDDMRHSCSTSICKPEDMPKGCDLDSDDECLGTEKFALQLAKYTQQVKESEGFDVEERGVGTFQPIPDFKEKKYLYAMVKDMALEALQTLNDSGKEYELVDVEKVVRTTNLFYYLTIKAKQLQAKDEEVMIQAIVFQTYRSSRSVELCRLKSDKLKK